MVKAERKSRRCGLGKVENNFRLDKDLKSWQLSKKSIVYEEYKCFQFINCFFLFDFFEKNKKKYL